MKELLIAISLFALFSSSVFSQTININADSVIRLFEHSPAAINVNYLMDDDSYLNPEIPLTESLKKMNIGMLRYPGGEKSDNYLWSVAPYESANPHFAVLCGNNFPNRDKEFSNDGVKLSDVTLDFDEFMTLCLDVGAQALIVVSGDAQFNKMCENRPTLEDLISNATEWIRYANITNNYNIKYWMVGNESWAKAAYYKPTCTPSQYAHDFVKFAKAMKAVDPTINVVANTTGKYADTLLHIAGDYIDAIADSYYPCGNWVNGYETFRSEIDDLFNNLENYRKLIGDRDIRVIITEYNSVDWKDGWKDRQNSLGHALVNFQTLGELMSIDIVDDAYLWNTRWIDNKKIPQHIYDALDSNGRLNATGKALALWGNYSLDKLVYSNNNGYIRSFATTDSIGSQLNIFLLNKDYEKHEIIINVDNFQTITSNNLAISEVKFSGSGIEDKFPTITYPEGSATIAKSQIRIELDPITVHILKLR